MQLEVVQKCNNKITDLGRMNQQRKRIDINLIRLVDVKYLKLPIALDVTFRQVFPAEDSL